MDNATLQFLVKAKSRGYSAGESAIQKESDGSYSSSYVDGKFSFIDNWDGGEPFGGRERLSVDGKPYWMMVYFGSVEKESEGVIPTLRAALSKLSADFPARGPRQFKNEEYVYVNEFIGDINRFEGKERILLNDQQVYSAVYAGGKVNQR